jgi:hypothetical protein
MSNDTKKWLEVNCELCTKSKDLQKVDVELKSSIYCSACKQWKMLLDPVVEDAIVMTSKVKPVKII